MPIVGVHINRYTDDSQPGWVECELVDVWDRAHAFVDKLPMFTAAALDAGSLYPQPGVIGCQVIREWRDEAGREIVTIDTELPDHVAAVTGETPFDVSPDQLGG